MTRRRTLINVFASLGVLIIGGAAAWLLLKRAPHTEKVEKKQAPKIVQTLRVAPQTRHVTVTAFGPVVPARRVMIVPQVAGRVLRMNENLVPGGLIPFDEDLIHIDPSDYELALIEQQAALEEAKFEYEVEKGRQVVAARELELLEGDLAQSQVNRSLVLREPHLRRTEAMIRRATNEIAKAELDLSRTTIKAPFNAMVLNESVETGQLVNTGNTVCTLVGTDEFWVQATLPLGDLKWIKLPAEGEPGASVTIHLDTGEGSGGEWQGRVVRLLSDLESTGRMARLLIEVSDPLSLKSGRDQLPLLIGSYARVEIDAGLLDNVLEIPRTALREGRRIWLVNQAKELQIRDAEILWTRKESFLISNVAKPGEALVVSGLRTALPGMKVEPRPLDQPELPNQTVSQ